MYYFIVAIGMGFSAIVVRDIYKDCKACTQMEKVMSGFLTLIITGFSFWGWFLLGRGHL